MTRQRSDAALGRRGFLKVSAAAVGAGLAPRLTRWVPPGTAEAQDPGERRYLFVVAALGGASIVDSFLPIAEGESARGASLTAIPDRLVAQPAGSGLRCVRPFGGIRSGLVLGNGYSQEDFLVRHASDTAVLQCTASSVNHATAQRRAMTGDGMFGGRTIAEAVAARWGEGQLLPNCNLAAGSYAEPGRDPALPTRARQVTVADPSLFALGTHGSAGIPGAPPAAALARARDVRRSFEDASAFGQTFGASRTITRYRDLRAQLPGMEAADLISKLLLNRNVDTGDLGLAPSPLLDRLDAAFPNLQRDSFEAQAALAFLLARYDLASAVTLSPEAAALVRREGGARRLVNTQLAFDYAHTDHRVAQSVMWSRVLRVVDGLITLLQETPAGTGDDGSSLWSRSLVYLATDFGRDRERPSPGAETFGTAHHLDNGVVLVSPLVHGNRAFGGVDPETCLTYGFDRRTGAPIPGSRMSNRDVYSVVAGALDVPFSGRLDVPAVIRGR